MRTEVDRPSISGSGFCTSEGIPLEKGGSIQEIGQLGSGRQGDGQKNRQGGKGSLPIGVTCKVVSDP